MCVYVYYVYLFVCVHVYTCWIAYKTLNGINWGVILILQF